MKSKKILRGALGRVCEIQAQSLLVSIDDDLNEESRWFLEEEILDGIGRVVLTCGSSGTV